MGPKWVKCGLAAWWTVQIVFIFCSGGGRVKGTRRPRRWRGGSELKIEGGDGSFEEEAWGGVQRRLGDVCGEGRGSKFLLGLNFFCRARSSTKVAFD